MDPISEAFKIHGGTPLNGTVTLSGAKNVALKTIIGALLFDGEVTLTNIPRINDVHELLSLINSLGGKAEFTDKNTVKIDGTKMSTDTVDMYTSSKIRVSFMLFAPLLHKFHKCKVANPGGCRIGARPIDRIIDGMKALGVNVSYDPDNGFYSANLNGDIKGEYTFAKPSHTGTELLILLAAIGNDTVTIRNAALEPEIDDLILFLNQSGAQITRNETDIVIHGVNKLHQTQEFAIIADRNEAVTYAVLAIASKGSIIVQSIEEFYIKAFNDKLIEAGAGVEALGENRWRYFYKGPIKATHIQTDVYPGFMTDWQPNWAVLMTQAEGESIIHERILEERFNYVSELKKIGAHIEFIDIHVDDPAKFYVFNYDPAKKYQIAIQIKGPQKLHNGVLNISDLRAGATLAIAALIAHGESIINGAPILERGYEDFVGKITALGGNIERL